MLSVRGISRYLATKHSKSVLPTVINNSSFQSHNHYRSYHSYPDPNEKPKITSFKNESKEKKLNKVGENGFSLADKFRLDNPFPGAPTPTGIKGSAAPSVKETKLPNGLLVATQEMPGSLMVTLGFIVKAGRYSIFISKLFNVKYLDSLHSPCIDFIL